MNKCADLEDTQKPFVSGVSYNSIFPVDHSISESEVTHIKIVNSNSKTHDSDVEDSTAGIFIYLHLPYQLLSCSMRDYAVNDL